jgi:hypothetical protein
VAGFCGDPAYFARTVSFLEAGLQSERSHMGGVGLLVSLDQFEHGIDRRRGRSRNTDNGDAGGNGQESPSCRIYGRVCGRRSTA